MEPGLALAPLVDFMALARTNVLALDPLVPVAPGVVLSGASPRWRHPSIATMLALGMFKSGRDNCPGACGAGGAPGA